MLERSSNFSSEALAVEAAGSYATYLAPLSGVSPTFRPSKDGIGPETHPNSHWNRTGALTLRFLEDLIQYLPHQVSAQF